MGQIFSDSVKHSIEIAQSLAKENHNEKFSPAHLLKALTHRDIGLRPFLESLGKDVNYLADWAEVRIDDYPKTGKVPESPAGDDAINEIFEEADILFFEGGNTFHLMEWVSKSGLANLLPEFLKTKVYVGASAGSMILSPDLILNISRR